eukprot:1160131-Pelagomonas_calceolata.AAC.3
MAGAQEGRDTSLSAHRGTRAAVPTLASVQRATEPCSQRKRDSQDGALLRSSLVFAAILFIYSSFYRHDRKRKVARSSVSSSGSGLPHMHSSVTKRGKQLGSPTMPQ